MAGGFFFLFHDMLKCGLWVYPCGPPGARQKKLTAGTLTYDIMLF